MTGEAACIPRAGRHRDVVRWSDVDAAGIVCYGRFLRFFEAAEENLFRAVGLPPEAHPRDHGVWLVRRSITVDFTRPLRLGDAVETAASIAAVGRTSLQIAFQVCCEGTPAAAARYLLVCVERESLSPAPFPPAMRERLVAAS